MGGEVHGRWIRAGMILCAAVVLFIGSPASGKGKSGLGTLFPEGENAVNGGFGFQAGLSDWAPGGFKWFNEYNRGLSDHVWLGAQITENGIGNGMSLLIFFSILQGFPAAVINTLELFQAGGISSSKRVSLMGV